MARKNTETAPEKVLRPDVDRVIRETKYSLSQEDVTEAIIYWLRAKGLHAPDQDRAKYRVYGHLTFDSGFTITWEEPATP